MTTVKATSRFNMVPMTRQHTIVVTAQDYRKLKFHDTCFTKSKSTTSHHQDRVKIRDIKTAPPGRNVQKTESNHASYTFQGKPAKLEVRPFSEGPQHSKRTRKHKTLGFKDRSYMSGVYSWAKAHEDSGQTIKGLELAEGILNYKAHRPQSSILKETSENEDPLRSGLGYCGYMDCLLRGRKKHLNKKGNANESRGITSNNVYKDMSSSSETPTLVPSNSLINE